MSNLGTDLITRKDPRDYQIECVDSIFNYFAHKTGNPLVAMPTGTGKSLSIAMFIEKALKLYPQTRIIVATHSNVLIKQNVKELRNWWPSAPIGINSAKLKKRDYYRQVTYVSIASVYKDAKIFKHIDLVLVDEAHLVSQTESSMYMTFFADLKKENPAFKGIGFTATKYRQGQGLLTDNGFFTDICFDITSFAAFNRLLDEGYLCPLRPKKTNYQLDVSGVGIGNDGDFIKGKLQEAVDRYDVTMSALKEALDIAHDKHKWLVFASGIEHCEHIVEILTYLGVSSRSVHSKKKDEENDETLKMLADGTIRAVVNNNCLCLDEETEILTDKGFVGIDEMTYQHKIAAWNTDYSVEFTYPEYIVKRERLESEKMVSVVDKSRNAKFRVTDNHRMVINSQRNKHDYKVISAKECLDYSTFKIPAFGICEPEFIQVEQPKFKDPIGRQISANSYNYRKKGYSDDEAKKLATAYTHKVRNLKYKNPNELSNDECFLIGFWLGDGTKSCGRVAFTQSEKYNNNVKIIDGLLGRLNITHSRQIYKADKTTTFNNIRWTLAKGTGGLSQQRENGFFEIEPYLDKKGSPYLKGLNKEQFSYLLQGLNLADGQHHSKDNIQETNIIVGQHYELFNLLQEIAVLRGFKAVIKKCTKPKNPNHKQLFLFSYNEEFQWGYNTKTQLEYEESFKKERVWCVTSTTSYLICRRKGKVFVTGNTTGFDCPDIDLIIILRPTRSTNLWVQMLGRGTRPVYAPGFNLKTIEGRLNAIKYGGKEYCLVLDFASNSEVLGPINDPVLPRKKGTKSGPAPVKTCQICGTYSHPSVKICPTCGTEFPTFVKFDITASETELIKTALENAPKFENFKVGHITFGVHNKLDAKRSIKVTYFCGKRSFTEYLCVEHGLSEDASKADKWARGQFEKWWTKRTNIPIPLTIDHTLQQLDMIKHATHLRVHINKKYPDIVNHCLEGTCFGTQEPISETPQIDIALSSTIDVRKIITDLKTQLK